MIKLEKCRGCKGAGYLERIITKFNHYKDTILRYTCPTCQGAKFVPKGTKVIKPEENSEYRML